MTPKLFAGLLSELWSDFNEPAVLWQVVVLVICIIAGWGLANVLRHWFIARRAQAGLVSLPAGEGFYRIFAPFLICGLNALALPIFSLWHRANLLRLSIALTLSYGVIRLCFYIVNRAFWRRNRESGVLVFEKVFATLVWLGVALYITGLWPDVIAYLDNTTFPLGRPKTSLLAIVQAAASVIVTLIIALWASSLLEERLMRMDGMHSSLRVVFSRLGRAVLILIAVLLSLSLVGIDLTVLSVFGGALGVGLGLGLQKLVSSHVSGFVILLERSLSIGDTVMVDKYYGQITQINTRYTVIRGGDGAEIVVPNDLLISGPVQNYSLTDRAQRIATRLTISSQSNIEHVIELLQAAAASVPRVSKQPAPLALFLEFAADGFLLELGFWISDPDKGRGTVLSDVNRAVWKTLQEHGIQVPYPQREIHLVEQRTGVGNPLSIK